MNLSFIALGLTMALGSGLLAAEFRRVRCRGARGRILYRGGVTGSGVLLIDKPPGITSHDVVARLRRRLGTRRVGHAGTLDPAATGLLLAGVGPATRLLTYLVGLDKEYEATIRLGESTTTDDAEGKTLRRGDASRIGRAELDAAVADSTGRILQVPSAVSAIKIDGRRAYARVRAGEEVDLPAREVTVSRFEVRAERRSEETVDLDVRVEVGSGTYVRALARDLGAALGVGGHLIALRRTRVGPFRIEDAVALEDAGDQDLRPAAVVAGELFPVARLDAEATRALRQGKRIRAEPDAPIVAALDPSGALIGLVAVDRGEARVLMNLPEPAEAER